jgi:plastocyanin
MTRLHAGLVITAALASTLALAEGARQSVAQKNRDFAVKDLSVARGETVRFTNEDDFLHQVFVHAPGFSFDSEEQPPGGNVDVAFTKAGDFKVLCGIHPKMSMAVHVR